MNRSCNMSKLMIGIASLTLSSGIWATSLTDLTMDDWMMNKMNEAEYMVTDSSTDQVKYLDAVNKGHMVSDDGAMKHKFDCMKGDKITNVQTHKSGIIKGVKHQGTMDVVTPNGKTVRYQYVTFKVKPL
ncbi:MAG: hypothetical protein P1U61_07070 [Legionellaceae bacterium]|nr:hypothetical protein [Legionellaceae bacterium]